MTLTQNDARSAYRSNTVSTATPGQLLVMLFDRLVLDVERGLRAQMKSDQEQANTQFQHAQAILAELQSSLDPEGWAGGHELMALYGYLQRRLIQANVSRDQRAAKESLILCRRLADTWKRAAVLAAQS